MIIMIVIIIILMIMIILMLTILIFYVKQNHGHYFTRLMLIFKARIYVQIGYSGGTCTTTTLVIPISV